MQSKILLKSFRFHFPCSPGHRPSVFVRRCFGTNNLCQWVVPSLRNLHVVARHSGLSDLTRGRPKLNIDRNEPANRRHCCDVTCHATAKCHISSPSPHKNQPYIFPFKIEITIEGVSFESVLLLYMVSYKGGGFARAFLTHIGRCVMRMHLLCTSTLVLWREVQRVNCTRGTSTSIVCEGRDNNDKWYTCEVIADFWGAIFV